MAATMRRPFSHEEQPAAQEKVEPKKPAKQPVPSYLTDNPSAYGEPPKPEADKD